MANHRLRILKLAFFFNIVQAALMGSASFAQYSEPSRICQERFQNLEREIEVASSMYSAEQIDEWVETRFGSCGASAQKKAEIKKASLKKLKALSERELNECTEKFDTLNAKISQKLANLESPGYLLRALQSRIESCGRYPALKAAQEKNLPPFSKRKKPKLMPSKKTLSWMACVPVLKRQSLMSYSILRDEMV